MERFIQAARAATLPLVLLALVPALAFFILALKTVLAVLGLLGAVPGWTACFP